MEEHLKEALEKINQLATELEKDSDTQYAAIVLYALAGGICMDGGEEFAKYVVDFAKAAHEGLIKLN